MHSYIGDDQALFELTLAAFLVAAGENAYFGAGNTWDTCESWLLSNREPGAGAGAHGRTGKGEALMRVWSGAGCNRYYSC